METLIVNTISDKWYMNVLEGVSKNVRKFDYWTNGWIPKNATRIEIYHNDYFALSGEVIDSYLIENLNNKNAHAILFDKNKDNLYAIGLKPQENATDLDGELNTAFSGTRQPKIGNIIFRVDSIGIVPGVKFSGYFDDIKITLPYNFNKIITISGQVKQGLRTYKHTILEKVDDKCGYK